MVMWITKSPDELFLGGTNIQGLIIYTYLYLYMNEVIPETLNVTAYLPHCKFTSEGHVYQLLKSISYAFLYN